jgi:uncharacterized protein DUF4129
VNVPVDVDRDGARERAAAELADPAYQSAEPSWLARAARWLTEALANLLAGAASITPGGLFGVIVLLLLLGAAIVLIRLRIGALAGTGRADRFVFEPGRPHSAREHRKAAELAAARGNLDEAVRERFRAIVRDLEQRGVLDERSGRTVDEIAEQAGTRLPGCADGLQEAARLFDDVVYGGRHATADGYRHLADLDARVQAERPALATALG